LKQIKYLGPFDAFDTGSMFDKRYEFTSPGEHTLTAFGRQWTSTERGQAVTVNNDHADELMTYPWSKEHHRFADATEQPEAPAAPATPAPPLAAMPTADKPALAPAK
jgi:hypothetical protein